MGIERIARIARNTFISDVVESIEKVTGETNINIQDIESTLMYTANAEECSKWEKWFELSNEPTWSLQDRRERLIYTFNSKGFFTPRFLKEQAVIFTNGEIKIEERVGEYHFILQFTSYIGYPNNIDNFERMVNVNKPAHLTWEWRARFRTHGELRDFTHSYLRNYTHKQIRELIILQNKGGQNGDTNNKIETQKT